MGANWPTTTADREFLFSYRFGGAEWGISIFANNPGEAREKIKAVALARYDGEVLKKFSADIPGALPFARLLCWWRNRKQTRA